MDKTQDQQNKEILEAQLTQAALKPVPTLINLVQEVMESHRDLNSPEYNECEKYPCFWCDLGQTAIDALKETNG